MTHEIEVVFTAAAGVVLKMTTLRLPLKLSVWQPERFLVEATLKA